MVECRLCGENFRKLSGHLIFHNMTISEYKEMFPDSPVISQESLEKHKIALAKGRETMKNKLKRDYRSKPEKEIAEFIERLGFDVYSPYRKLGKEIDIFVPSANLAIEYNGLRYHSELFGGKDRNYHISKTKLCSDNGIRLLHIFEDEYLSRKRIVLTKIAHILKCSMGDKIYARECKIKEVPKEERRQFFAKNHIQGNASGNICYGLYKNGRLVSAMLFSEYSNKNTGKQDNVYELERFATDIDIIGVGMAGKLISHFWKKINPMAIITFADLRWSSLEGNMYSSLGFELDGITPPDYYYVHGYNFHKRLHKFGFDKKKQASLFGENFNLENTEWENMKANGYDRLWDVGKARYIMKSPDYQKPCKKTEVIEKKFHKDSVFKNLGVDNRLIPEQGKIELLKVENKSKAKPKEPVEQESPYSNKVINPDFDWNSLTAYKNTKTSVDLEFVKNTVDLYLNQELSLREISSRVGKHRDFLKGLFTYFNINVNTERKQWKGGKKANQARYHEKHKEVLKEKKEKYVQENKEKIKERTDRWRQENKEYIANVSRRNYLKSKGYGLDEEGNLIKDSGE